MNKQWVLAVTSAAFFMVALDALVVTTALPAIGRDLHAGLSSRQWTVNAYGLSYAAGIITAAALGDRFGRRRVFTLGLVVFTLASAGCALAPSVDWLLAARTVQGIGAAAVMPLSLTILTGAYPAEKRGAIVGVWGGLGGLAVAGGPLIGGAVTEGLSWHWIFWLNVPIGLVAVLLSRSRLPESHGPRTALDVPALVLLTGAAFGLVWGLVRVGTTGWRDLATLVALAGGAVALVAFVVWERRSPAPMLPMRMFKVRAFAAANIAGLCMIAALTGAVFLIAQYCQLVLGESPLATGVRLLPWTATPLLIAPLAGRLSDRVGRRVVLTTGLVLQAIGLGWFAAVVSAVTSYAAMAAPLVLAGIGISMAIPTAAAAALGAVAPDQIGRASGVSSTLQRFGAVFGVAVVTTVFTASGRIGTPATFTDGLRPALAVAAILSLVGALASVGVTYGRVADSSATALVERRRAASRLPRYTKARPTPKMTRFTTP
jgi:EmrB/QacA subfamily drug resistance transporter